MDAKLHEATLHYEFGQYHVVRPGSYVTCSMTGLRIHLEDLRYWNVERQEPYATAAAATKREADLSEVGA